jgi:hypothetical protein
MSKQTKLIVGAVVVLGAYYLYTKNKTKMEVADLKEGAETPAPETIKPIIKDFSSYVPTQLEGRPFRPMTSVPLEVTELRADSIQLAQGGKKFSNFAGSRDNSISAQYFR